MNAPSNTFPKMTLNIKNAHDEPNELFNQSFLTDENKQIEEHNKQWQQPKHAMLMQTYVWLNPNSIFGLTFFCVYVCTVYASIK